LKASLLEMLIKCKCSVSRNTIEIIIVMPGYVGSFTLCDADNIKQRVLLFGG
jgi:hypothetical protein